MLLNPRLHQDTKCSPSRFFDFNAHVLYGQLPFRNSMRYRIKEKKSSSLLGSIFDLNCYALTFTVGRLMHTNPTLQLIRLATHPTLTPISENTGFSENDFLMIESINCVIVYFILRIKSLLAPLMKAELLAVSC